MDAFFGGAGGGGSWALERAGWELGDPRVGGAGSTGAAADVPDLSDQYAGLGISPAEWEANVKDELHAQISRDIYALPAPQGQALAALDKARSGPLGAKVADAAAHAVALLRSSGMLSGRPTHLEGASAPFLFLEERGGGHRYSRAQSRPYDVWRQHGGTSVTQMTLPSHLQLGPNPQVLIRRLGKIVRHGLPELRFHQYEIAPVPPEHCRAETTDTERRVRLPSSSAARFRSAPLEFAVAEFSHARLSLRRRCSFTSCRAARLALNPLESASWCSTNGQKSSTVPPAPPRLLPAQPPSRRSPLRRRPAARPPWP